MSGDEWKDLYKQYSREWKEGYRKALREWRERYRDWKVQAKAKKSEGPPFTMPPLPEMPPMPFPMPHLPTGRSNVVASRIGDEELRLIDMLIEAGVFGTRSEAVAYLVREGINARQDVLDKVSSSLEDIRRIRKEAEEQVAKLKKEIGVAEPAEEAEQVDIEVTGEQERKCQKCGKDLSDLPEDISVCPYCGTSLQETSEHSGSIFRRLKRSSED